MGLFQSKPSEKKTSQSSQGQYVSANARTLTGLHPSSVSGATTGGRRRKHKTKGARKNQSKKRSRRRH